MTTRIKCQTRFDITATGVRSHLNRARFPYRDDAGTVIQNEDQWIRSRNQQRNWETLNQIISLRSLPIDISDPKKIAINDSTVWEFEFSVENVSQLSLADGDLGALLEDCRDVPMITGLDEDIGIASLLQPNGDSPNILFKIENK